MLESSPQCISSDPSPQSLTPSQTTPSGPAGTQRPFSHRNSFSLQPPTVETGEGGVGVVNQWKPVGEGSVLKSHLHTKLSTTSKAALNYLLTIPTAHDLKSKVDAVLEVMWQQADKLSRHHPVQSTLCHPSIILVTLKNLEGEWHSIVFKI